MRLAVPLLAALLFAGCAHVPRGSVVAEGWGLDRKRALALALRAAVEKALGVNVSARTSVKNAAVFDQRVAARSAGRVTRHEVLGEERRDGLLVVRVRAWVEAAPPEEMPPLPPPGDPKVAVLLDGPPGAGARAGLSRAGFTVVSDSAAADFLVSGDSSVARLGWVGDWDSMRARVSLSARRKDGTFLAEARREASGAAPSAVEASARAEESAGILGGETLAAAISRRLE